MSHAFGNRMLKQLGVAEPEIQEQEINEEFDCFCLQVTDYVVSNEDVILLAQTEDESRAAAQKLTEAAFTRGSADNITCIVVKFHHAKAGEVKNRDEKNC